MKLRNKKGFTIIELVIVIAVIGILTAVLVPTFINLTNRANEAADQSLIKNLNTALKMEEQTAGHKKAPTLQGAIDDLENQGYLLENLQSKSGLDLLWDQEDNQFLLNKDGVAGAKYWKIVDALPGLDQQVYSYYAGQYFSSNTVANVKYGFDVGDNENIDKITFENTGAAREGTIAIRTNGGELTINAPQDSVNHYGKVDSLKIQAIKGNSLHVYGTVKYAEISVGRIAMESGSKIDCIHVNAKETTAEKPTEFNEVIIAKDQSVDMPKLSRDDVEIASTGTLVVALQAGTEEVTPATALDYVWLTKQGIYEQITVSNSKTDKGSTWVNTSDKSAETKEAAKQIANNIGRNEDGQVTETTTVDEKEYKVTVDPVTREIVVKDAETGATASAEVAEKAKEQAVEAQPDKEDVQTGAVLFAGGTGTQKDPFLIVDYDTFQHVSDLYDEGYYYFKVKDGVKIIDCANWKSVKLCGSFDGNGVTLNKPSDALFECVVGVNQDDAYVKNFIIYDIYEVRTGYYCAPVVDWTEELNVFTVDNVKVSGYAEATIVSSFVGWSEAKTTLIKNSESTLTLVSTGNQVSGFVGNSAGVNNVTVIDSIFSGSEVSTANSGQYLYAHNNGNCTLTLSYTDSFKETHSNLYPEFTNAAQQLNTYSVYSKITKQSLVLPEEIGTPITVEKDSTAVKAVATYVIGVNPGCFTRVFQRDEIDLTEISESTFNTITVMKYNVVINDGIHGNEAIGNTQYIKDSACDGTYECVVFTVVQYDTTGSITSIRTISLPGNH